MENEDGLPPAEAMDQVEDAQPDLEAEAAVMMEEVQEAEEPQQPEDGQQEAPMGAEEEAGAGEVEGLAPVPEDGEGENQPLPPPPALPAGLRSPGTPGTIRSARSRFGSPSPAPSRGSQRGSLFRSPALSFRSEVAPPTPGSLLGADLEAAAGEGEERAEEPEDEELRELAIWGTNYLISNFVQSFRHFLRTFRLPRRRRQAEDGTEMEEEEEGEREPHYLMLLREIHDSQESSINVNCRHLWNHLPARRLYSVLLRYPTDAIVHMDMVINAEYTRIYQEERRIQVRVFNLRRLCNMRDINPEDIDRLVAIRGMVIRVSNIIPDLDQGFFRCFVCGAETVVGLNRGRIDEPASCAECHNKGSMELILNRSVYLNKQVIRMQETPDEIPEGETPNSVTIYAFEGLTDVIRPGDRIEVTGIVRASPARVHHRMRSVRSVYKTHVEAIHFSHISQDVRVEAGPGDGTRAGTARPGTNEMMRQRGHNLSEDRVAEIRQLSQDPNIYQKLANAVAPSIWELDDVKKGVLCLMFGGTNKRVVPGYNVTGMPEDDEEEEDGEPRAGKVNCRGDLNILLCGDPGTSKSQLLLYVHKLSPRGIYTSGKGSSAVGLTASVIRDSETKELVLESGALVLSDQGVCCIDEFDKMSETTRAVLHEAMEQQTVSIAKAGIICTLNARTSILASANPVESRYNPKLSVVENIKLPPTLLSRFDLIYLVLDRPQEEEDRRLARHLVSLYYEVPELAPPDVDHDLLKDYIAYARANVHPVISEEAGDQLVHSYLSLRGNGGGEGKTITATARQLESLIRLSEALAKVRLSPWVEVGDVEEAMRLMHEATLKAATDPETGRLDLGNLDGSSREREARSYLANELKTLFAARKGQSLSVTEIRQAIQAQTNQEVKQHVLVDVLRKELEPEGIIKYKHASHTVQVHH